MVLRHKQIYKKKLKKIRLGGLKYISLIIILVEDSRFTLYIYIYIYIIFGQNSSKRSK